MPKTNTLAFSSFYSHSRIYLCTMEVKVEEYDSMNSIYTESTSAFVDPSNQLKRRRRTNKQEQALL